MGSEREQEPDMGNLGGHSKDRSLRRNMRCCGSEKEDLYCTHPGLLLFPSIMKEPETLSLQETNKQTTTKKTQAFTSVSSSP